MYPQGIGFLKGALVGTLNSPVEQFIEQEIATGNTTPCDQALDRMRVK
jgi:hypothetical protein